MKINSTKNCLFCKRFSTCKDIKKSRNYICDKFKKHEKIDLDSLTKTIDKVLNNNDKDEFELPEHKKVSRRLAGEIQDSKFDFESLVENVIQNEKRNPLPPDIRIDDRDLPQAKNFYEFCNKEFLDFKAWPKQIEIAAHTFAEICPRCSDMSYADDIPKKASRSSILKHVTFLEYGVCPTCNGRRSKFLKREQMKVPNELVGLAGQRSAKSLTSVALAAYLLHQCLKLQHAPIAYGLLPNTVLHGMMVALTFKQAEENLWQPFSNLISDSPWFKQYHQLMDFYGNKYSEEIYKFKDTFISYRARRLLIYPRGPDKRTMRGRTLLFAILDEIGWFGVEDKKIKIKINADEIYTALSNASRTVKSASRKRLRRGNDSIPQPLLISISSPTSKKDKICRLIEVAKTNDEMHWFHYATWEMNKELDRRDFDSDYATKGYAIASRDYAAIPPSSAFPYIAKYQHFSHAFKNGVVNLVKLNPMTVRYARRDVSIAKAKIISSTTNNRVLAIDAGYNNNSFAFVGGYLDEENNTTVIDVLGEIIPSLEAPVNFTLLCEEVLNLIIEKCNVKVVVADRWQSIKLLQDLGAVHEDVEVLTYSVKYKDFSAYKEDLLNKQILFPPLEKDKKYIDKLAGEDYPHSFEKMPMLHLAHQILTVQDMQKDVTKGDNSTDDLFRASVLAHRYINDPEYRELLSGDSEQIESNGVIAVWGSKSGGVGNINVGSNLGVYGSIKR